MVTKESLLERKAQIESDLAVQHEVARQAEGQRQEAIAKLAGCRDMVNALSGAKQDVEHWLAKFPQDPSAEPVETIIPKDDQPAAEPRPPKEPVN